MKFKFAMIILVLFIFIGMVWAGTIGDIDGDDKITLVEAVGSLQVASGKTVASYSDREVYNMSEYLLTEELPYKKVWEQTEFGSGLRKKGIGVVRFFQHNVNGQDVIAKAYESGLYADFNCIDYLNGNTLLGWQWSNYEELFDPPITTSMDNWPMGHRITDMSVLISNPPGQDINENLRYREYTLLGVEDVVVPAGTFKHCLKILGRRSIQGRATISYLAKGVGMVKYQRAQSTGGGQLWELLDIEKTDGTTLFGKESGFCRISGTWSTEASCPPYNGSCVQSSNLTMLYDKTNGISSFLNLSGFPDAWNLYGYGGLGLKMVTDDGITFTPDPTINWPDNNYDGNPDLPDISLTVEGDIVTGTFIHNANTFNLTGTLICP